MTMDAGADRSIDGRFARRSFLRTGTVLIAGGLGAWTGRVVATTSTIDSWDDLAALDGESGHATLTTTLDADSPGYDQVASPAADGGAGWAPIDFHGTLDGGGYAVADLAVNRSGSAGLFATLDGAEVADLTLTGIDITGGAITGGLVGEATASTITDCWVDGSVTGTNEIGGLVGRANPADLERVACAGTVTGDWEVGGLVGRQNGTLADGYTLAEVDGSVYVGGAAGMLSGTAERVFAAGAVDDGTATGGLVGYNTGTLAAANWDRGTTGQDDAVGVGDSPAASVSGHGSVGDEISASAMIGTAPLPVADGGDGTMDHLDFDGTWSVVAEGVSLDPEPSGAGYPILDTLDTDHQLAAQGLVPTPESTALIAIDAEGSVSITNVTVNE